MTSQGSAHGGFIRAIAQKNVRGAEIAAKEMGGLSLIYALDYVVLVAELQPERAQAAAIRWHGRAELETVELSLPESRLALAALASLVAGDPDSAEILKRLLRRAPDSAAARGVRSARLDCDQPEVLANGVAVSGF